MEAEAASSAWYRYAAFFASNPGMLSDEAPDYSIICIASQKYKANDKRPAYHQPSMLASYSLYPPPKME
ncbi:hypothetical protein KIH86_18545 [Paenibacillus sp. HN-1]|uniref:hypothetical protein n=1 Tax=Paenibacillus TaxID=44249 RepID=UPI001CA9E17B|nr:MULTISPECIES: hypothetical protein [Paenibacillus]MBY9076946.1 hypothetical protein [Paenibacillus sp. CGMCC 1.18879]MBY9086211.1 hypothetical protein [Paenibacillus sinensis]